MYLVEMHFYITVCENFFFPLLKYLFFSSQREFADMLTKLQAKIQEVFLSIMSDLLFTLIKKKIIYIGRKVQQFLVGKLVK